MYASAALGVAQRQGLGKLRHLQTGALGIQEQHFRKPLSLNKMQGAENCSNPMTKNASRELVKRHVSAMNGKLMGGQDEAAVQLHCVERNIRQAQATLNLLKDKTPQVVNSLNESPIDAMVDSKMNNVGNYLREM